MRLPIGQKLYFSIMGIFLLFAFALIMFQQNREKQFKIENLNIQLQGYNDHMQETLSSMHRLDATTMAWYVKMHNMPGLRVTVVDHKGNVVFDNKMRDTKNAPNHLSRPEIRQALSLGKGYIVDRKSNTLNHDYFYSATYYPRQRLIVRSALPWDNNLARSLSADQHYIWFTLGTLLVLTIVLWRFTNRLGKNIGKLRIFATKADHNESLDIEDLAVFPNDELGEIAERIIKLYKRLQSTRKEQDILKRQLTQNIAHELKTPVASIQGYMETILGNENMPEDTKRQFMERCYAQSQRLTSLLHDISTLNRMDDAPEQTEFSVVDISAMVANIKGETALQLAQRDMALENMLPTDILVRGNQSLLYSVFRNLVDNSIAYAGNGTTIRIEAKKEYDRWHFTFSDNGVGVPREHLQRLFERFYRVDKGRSRKMGGTGLGLAIVKNAVLLHGGKISVDNQPTGGLVFNFTLPEAS